MDIIIDKVSMRDWKHLLGLGQKLGHCVQVGNNYITAANKALLSFYRFPRRSELLRYLIGPLTH